MGHERLGCCLLWGIVLGKSKAVQNILKNLLVHCLIVSVNLVKKDRVDAFRLRGALLPDLDDLFGKLLNEVKLWLVVELWSLKHIWNLHRISQLALHFVLIFRLRSWEESTGASRASLNSYEALTFAWAWESLSPALEAFLSRLTGGIESELLFLNFIYAIIVESLMNFLLCRRERPFLFAQRVSYRF